MLNKKDKPVEKKWILRADTGAAAKEEIAKIARELGVHPVIATLLHSRGFTDPKAAKTFLHMESELLYNPFRMKDIDRAVERIGQAVAAHERITVYGDYDVDGVTSVCTLYLYLRSKGADIGYYIPNRAGEGYGVSKAAIDTLRAEGTSLIITVDTGITANEEIDYAKEQGVDFVVTDHHECRPELPRACAVVNPHRPDCPYPFKDLAGVGVVFKLISAYEEKTSGDNRSNVALRIFTDFADLVAIGTIADVMPVREENRIIVKYGLHMIENRPRLGLSALIEAATGGTQDGKDKRKKTQKITSGYIGYTLAPRINAAGRILSASIAVELFLAEDYARALSIAKELCRANNERKAEENKIMKEAYEQIGKLDIDRDPVIVLDADTWHHGVIGIVSSRITEKYCRPSILVSFEGNDPEHRLGTDVGKGSGRSVRGMNLVDALCSCEDVLVKFGGHELAAGLSVTRENLPEFRRKINDYARAHLTKEDLVPTMEADCVVKESDVTLSLAEELRILEPYGVGNPVPAFVLEDVGLVDVAGVSEGKHTRLTVGDGRNNLSCMYFSVSPDTLGVYPGDRVDLMFNLDINEWMGRKSAQLIIRDLHPSGSQESKAKREENRFLEIWNGAYFTKEENVLPDREDFAAVYRFILMMLHAGTDTVSHRDMVAKLSRGPESAQREIGYIKLKIIIKVLHELNIAQITEPSPELYVFRVQYRSSKADLDKSSVLRRLRKQMNSVRE